LEKRGSHTYFHGLDGLRGFAAMMVVLGISKASRIKPTFFPSFLLQPVDRQGDAPQGVNIFFTLSGFLITYCC